VKSLKYILLFLFLAGCSAAADTTRVFIGWDGTAYHEADQGPRIGLALSGGGARGIAHAGVLQALEESGIKISAIAGTSIGGIVGGLYASGYSAIELKKIVKEIDFSELFSNRPSRTTLLLTQREEMERYLLSIRFDGYKPFIPQALTSGQNLSDLLTRLTLKASYISGGDFERLEIPFYAVTTDIVTGDKVVISKGNLADAMRSTMAFPLAFTGIEMEEKLLMDGGLVDPIPVMTIKKMAPDIDLIVGVNTTSDLLPRNKINNPIDIANQVTSIMSMDKLQSSLAAADVVIEPAIEEYTSADFESVDDLIRLGYEAGLKAANEIYKKCGDICRGDSVYLVDVRFDTSLFDPGKSGFPFTSAMLISIEDILETADVFFKDNSFLSLSIDIITGGLSLNGYKAAALEIKAVPAPKIEEISMIIKGNSVFDDSTIAGLLDRRDNLLSAGKLSRFSDSLVDLYESKGYDLAHIRSLRFLPETKELMVDIDEALVERIMVFGNRRTKQWLIKSNYPQDIDAPFSSRNARRGIANIYATDLFDRVIINVVPGNRGAIVHITVKEKEYTQMRLGWHLHEKYKNESFIEILDDNLFGTGQELMAHARYSKRRQKYELTLKADRFFSTYFTYNLTGFYHFTEHDIYDENGESIARREEDRYGFEFFMGHQIARFGTVSGGIGWVEIKDEYDPYAYSDRIKLRSLILKSEVETINRYPFPTHGKRHIFSARFATDILGGEYRYTKLHSLIESYWPLPGGLNFHPAISIGLTDAEAGIPVSERFYLGGHYSFYGFAYNELVGAKMLLNNFELRLRLPYNLYLYGRYDLGQVYGEFDDIKLKNLRHGYGFSLAFDSPVGPIDFGYGKSGNHPERWYLDIGLAF